MKAGFFKNIFFSIRKKPAPAIMPAEDPAVEKDRIEFYRQFIRTGELVFDVGANLGNRTRTFLDLGAHVIAFEPQKVCADHLRQVFSKEADFTLVRAALGGWEGEMDMLISSAHTISTLSPQWVKATKESGRFSQYDWNEKQRVKVTTLDSAIQKFGAPVFIKIDVEGYEFEVLQGLSCPVKCLSIEFASETLENTFKCIDHLRSLSNVSYQLSLGETMHFHLPGWVTEQEIKDILSETCSRDKLAWGDVYIKKAPEINCQQY